MIRAERKSPVITQMEQYDPGKSARLVKCSWETLGQERGNLPHSRQSLTFGMVMGVCVWGVSGGAYPGHREKGKPHSRWPQLLWVSWAFGKGLGMGRYQQKPHPVSELTTLQSVSNGYLGTRL